MARPEIANPFTGQIGTVGPTATPTEIYQRGVVTRSPFVALAKTLSLLEQKATPAIQAAEARAAEAEYAEGVELYNANRVAMGEAVKNGIIQEGESPYLRKGYRISHLNTMAARYTDELQNALVAKKLYKNGDPKAIEDFTNKFHEEFQTANGIDGYRDVEVAEFFSGAAAKANETFRSAWKEKNIAYQKEANYSAWSMEVSTYTDTLFLAGDTEEAREKKQGQLAVWLSQKVKEADLDGMSRTKINETVINSIVLTAYEKNDLSVLDVLDQVVTGTGLLGRGPAARLAVYEARGNIATTIAKAEKAQAAARLASQKVTIAAASGEIIMAALVDRGSQDAEVAQKAQEVISAHLNELTVLATNGVAGAGAAAMAMTRFIDEQQKAKLEENSKATPNSLFGLQMDIMQETDINRVYNEISQARREGRIQGKDMAPLLSQWQTLAGANAESQLAIFDNSSPASNTRDNFVLGLGYDTTLGEFAGENKIRTALAIDTFNMEYLKAAAALKASPERDGSPLTYLEQLQVAQQVQEAITPSFVSIDSLNLAGEAQERNQVAIQAAAAEKSEQAAMRVLLVKQALAQNLNQADIDIMSNEELLLALTPVN